MNAPAHAEVRGVMVSRGQYHDALEDGEEVAEVDENSGRSTRYPESRFGVAIHEANLSSSLMSINRLIGRKDNNNNNARE